MGFPALYRVFTRFSWVFTGFLLGLTGFDWVWLGLTRFDWVFFLFLTVLLDGTVGFSGFFRGCDKVTTGGAAPPTKASAVCVSSLTFGRHFRGPSHFCFPSPNSLLFLFNISSSSSRWPSDGALEIFRRSLSLSSFSFLRWNSCRRRSRHRSIYWMSQSPVPSFTEFDSIFLDFTKFYWVLLGFTRYEWVLTRFWPGFTGFYWVLLDFTEFYWVLPSFTGFYGVLLGFTGLYLVLLGFTGY